METQSGSIAGRLVTETGDRMATVNDCLPDVTGPGSIAFADLAEFFGQPEPGDLPETEPLAASDAVTVSISRATLEILVLAADLLREHAKVIIEATPGVVGLDTLDVLADSGLIDPETLETTQSFDVACALGGIALGLDVGLGELPPDDGDGVDALGGADNDDFDDDVAVAEQAFEPAADADWPGEPVRSVLDLPRASGFGGD